MEVLVGDENGLGTVQDVLLRRHRAWVNYEALGIFFQSHACVAELRKFHFVYVPSILRDVIACGSENSVPETDGLPRLYNSGLLEPMFLGA